MSAIVIGNGKSRSSIDLSKIKSKTYGCNALYRHFVPDVLVATDDPISREIQSSGYAKKNIFYTRKVYSGTGAKKLQPQYINWSSGPNALQLAVNDNHKEIILIGFDFGSTTKEMNNIYANTEFYDKDNPVLFSGNWLNQVETIMKTANNVDFSIVANEHTTSSVQILNNLPNVNIIWLNSVMENKK